MTASITVSSGTHLFHLPLEFALRHGGVLHGAQLAFELFGPAHGPLVVVQGGISSDRRVTGGEAPRARGWWQDLVGPGRALDTTRVRVLGIDHLGGNGASTGPRSRDGIAVPAVTPADQARATALLLAHLGEGPAHFVGASYGGMVGLALAAEHPECLARLVAISAAHRSHPRATAGRWIQRQVVQLGIAQGVPGEALALARALAMTSYRTAEELGARFDAAPSWCGEQPEFAVARYLRARGEAFAADFDPDAFLCLSQALDLHRVDPRRITAPTTLIGVPSDPLVPIEDVRATARALAGPVRLVELPSRYGHDAFLKETEALASVLREALGAQEVAA